MASKSKKRRRVLGASCILAALIIAGSSFAWFTSKDEVTNRLTANSDYGVSIVESFAPPKNMLPGETVNKDVYAVNTGTVDAYVKEDVEAILKYNYEETVNSFAATNVELTLTQVAAIQGGTETDGYKTYEGGGYLVWTDADEDVGSINSARTQDVTTPWAPTKSGAYIFRRSITGDATNPFTYAGYYFDENSGKYYKIVLDGDAYPVSSTDNTVTPVDFVFDIYADSKNVVDGVTEEYIDPTTGEIKKGFKGYKFVALTEVPATKLTMEYDAAKKRLVASYTPVADDDTSARYDANALAAQKEIAYQNALGTYDATKDSYDNAVANYEYAKALATAKNKLIDAKNEVNAKYDALNTDDSTANPPVVSAQTAYENAREAVNDYAQDMQDGTKNKITPDANKDGVLNRASGTDIDTGKASLAPTAAGIMTDGEMNAYSNTSSNPYIASAALPRYRAAFDAYKALYDEIYTDVAESGTPGEDGYVAPKTSLYTEVNDLLNQIKAYSDGTADDTTNPVNPEDDADQVATLVQQLQAKTSALEAKMKALKQAYFNFTDAAAQVTGLTDGDDNTAEVGTLDTMITAATHLKQNADSLKLLSDTFTTKEHEKETAAGDLTTAENAWKAAVDTYNKEVRQAQLLYKGDSDVSADVTDAAEVGYTVTLDGVITKITKASHYDTVTDKHDAQDKNNTLVQTYSANRTASATDPRIDATAAKADGAYRTINIGTKTDPIPNEDADDFKVNDLVNKSGDERDNPTGKTVSQWRTALETAEGNKNTAKAAYDDAVAALAAGKTITFYINLAEDYDTYWQFDGANGTKTDDAEFYLKKVLLGGETSHKLIDSVEFDKDTTAAAYKNLTFDLNVGLDSIQVTYDADQRNYSTEAVNAADDTFKLDVTNAAPITEDTVLTWGTT